MMGDQFSAISKVIAVLIVALCAAYCQVDAAPTCKEASIEAISAGNAANMCAGNLLGLKGYPIADLDTCLIKYQRALSLLDEAETACQSQNDILEEIALYRRDIQKVQKVLEINKGVGTGTINPVDALQRLLDQVPGKK